MGGYEKATWRCFQGYCQQIMGIKAKYGPAVRFQVADSGKFFIDPAD